MSNEISQGAPKTRIFVAKRKRREIFNPVTQRFVPCRGDDLARTLDYIIYKSLLLKLNKLVYSKGQRPICYITVRHRSMPVYFVDVTEESPFRYLFTTTCGDKVAEWRGSGRYYFVLGDYWQVIDVADAVAQREREIEFLKSLPEAK